MIKELLLLLLPPLGLNPPRGPAGGERRKRVCNVCNDLCLCRNSFYAGRLTGRGLSINCVVVADVAVLLAILLGLS